VSRTGNPIGILNTHYDNLSVFLPAVFANDGKFAMDTHGDCPTHQLQHPPPSLFKSNCSPLRYPSLRYHTLLLSLIIQLAPVSDALLAPRPTTYLRSNLESPAISI